MKSFVDAEDGEMFDDRMPEQDQLPEVESSVWLAIATLAVSLALVFFVTYICSLDVVVDK